MTPQADGHSHEHRQKRRAWRIGTPLVFALSGGLFMVSADNSDGTDLRPGRNTSLASLVRSESRQVQDLERRAADLTNQIDALSATLDDREVQQARAQARELRSPAGYAEVSGPGVTVVLSDAPREVRATSDADVNLLVVHQQDIQAVVNALWRAGARAITIQGQRVISTTGIKCSGNSVELHGIPYAEPYRIQAVGDPDELAGALEADAYLAGYRRDAARPDVQVGWSLEENDLVTAPAYTAIFDFEYAQPLPVPETDAGAETG